MLHEVKGDALGHEMDRRPLIIAHVVNDVGGWGRGFVVPLAKRWPQARSAYKRGWRKHRLGDVQYVEVEDTVTVANMFAQHGLGRGQRRLRYGALRAALQDVAKYARNKGARIQMPKVGCGLAGGRWDTVRGIVEEELDDLDVTVCII
jgi:O-acetyl-ADP-ribose deacetylase (regulator of RNase III)